MIIDQISAACHRITQRIRSAGYNGDWVWILPESIEEEILVLNNMTTSQFSSDEIFLGRPIIYVEDEISDTIVITAALPHDAKTDGTIKFMISEYIQWTKKQSESTVHDVMINTSKEDDTK